MRTGRTGLSLLGLMVACLTLMAVGCDSGAAEEARLEPQPHDGMTGEEYGRSLHEDAPLAIALEDRTLDPDRVAASLNEREEWTLQCLRDQGIVPEPTPTATADYSGSFWVLPDSMSEFEFIATYGYGLTEWAKRLRIEDGLLDTVNELVSLPPIDRDPKVEAAQAARSECLFRLIEADLGADVTPRDVLQESLGAELQQLQDRISSDPRQEEFRTTWVDCMEDAGHRWDSVSDIHDMVRDELDKVQQDLESSSDVLRLLSLINEAELAPLNADQRRALIQNSGAVRQVLELPGVREELARVQAMEVEAALADYQCTEGWYEIQLQIQFEAEQDFVDAHREAIARAVDEAATR